MYCVKVTVPYSYYKGYPHATPFSISKKSLGGGNLFLGAIPVRGLVVPCPTIVKTFSTPMRSYPVKENPIGSAVSEILRYKQTDRQTSFYFVL